MSKTAKVDHKDNGYDVKCTHSGQRHAYGDTFREFTVTTDKPLETGVQTFRGWC